jgi:Cu+-exporting ATPase
LVCPVTGETIASIKAAAGHSVYKGKTYYFCCPGCKPLFDANPSKYVKSATAANVKS